MNEITLELPLNELTSFIFFAVVVCDLVHLMATCIITSHSTLTTPTMTESLDELKDVLLASLKSLEEEKESYLLIEKQLKTLASHNQDVSSSSGKRLICIGCDLWIEMSQIETKAYFDRKIKANSQNLLQITEKINRSRTMIDDILPLIENPSHSQPSEELNEEGLPILDIQETLDDDDTVLSVKINDKPVEFKQHTIEKKGVRSSKNLANSTKSSKNEKKNTEKIEFIENFESPTAKDLENDNNDQIEELLADMEIVAKNANIDSNKESSQKDLEANLTNVDSLEELHEDSTPAIRPEDIYELELIASELAPDDEDGEYDDEGFDFEMDDSVDENENDGDGDDDDDDDAKADEILYGGNFGMFTGNSPLQDRLWGEIQALRNQKLNEIPPVEASVVAELKAKLKVVRFNETTEIKEIENVSESLKKIEHKKQKPLRFRESLISAGRSEFKKERPTKLLGNEEVTRDITDRSDIIENSNKSEIVWESEVCER